MKNRGENFVTTILMLAIVVIFSITTYFCLDIFEIINVPEQYSLVSLLGSKIELSTVAENIEDIVPDEGTIKKKIIVSTENKTDTNANVQAPTFDNVKEENNIAGDTSNFEASNSVEVENKYYYNQLDVYAKAIYDDLYSHKEDLKTGLYTLDFDIAFNALLHEDSGAETLEKDFQLAVNALVFDKPEIFYLDITKMYLLTEITTFGPKKTYRVSIGPSNNVPYLSSSFPNIETIRNAEFQIENLVQSLRFSNDKYYQIREIHDFIVENTEYDETVSKSNIYNIYGTLINKEAVCEGYAKTFKYILDKLDIPCIIACGIGQNSKGQTESHAWNYVKLNDVWYAVDVTWDDPVIIGNGSVTNEMRYHYFLRGSNSFFKDHTEDGNLIGNFRFTYPNLSIEDYKNK
jgi:hypothetical protein